MTHEQLATDQRRTTKAGIQPAFSATRPILSSSYFTTLALLSGGGLFLEIALTRLFSTLFFPPSVFAIISVAVLGIGLGAALATAYPGWRNLNRLPLYLALTGYTTLALLLISVWTAAIDLYGGLFAVVLIPYLFIGLALATMFSAAPAASPRLYRADLLGAGLGAILAIPVLNWLGGLNSIFLVAGVFGVAALIALPHASLRPWPLALCGLAGLGLITNLVPSTSWLDVDMANLSSAKPITGSLAAGGRIIQTHWDSFARTDLVDPGQGRPYELYLDGAAGSVMPPARDLNLLRADIGFFPFATAQPEQVLVVGPGGGLDVWFGLNSQAASITAVEINPASVDIVNQYAGYHGDIYRQPTVRVIIDEGRSVLRRADQTYDLIFLSQVVTLASERNGYTLTENTIYTVEAFVDYLNHLKADGQIALKLYDELTLTRAMVTAVTALVQTRGLSEAEAMAHIAVFLDPDADPPVPLLLVQDQPFSPVEAQSYAEVASRVDFVPLFVPGVTGAPPLDGLLRGENRLSDIIAASRSNIFPTTDDRPFFYQFERGLPESLQPLLWGLGAVVLVGLGGLVMAQRPITEAPLRYAPLYFAALGVGFITIEIVLIQQTRLFLGHPTLAVTTILGGLLIGGGIGSDLAGRWPDRAKSRRLFIVLVLIAGLALLWLAIWPWLNNSFLALPTSGRGLVAVGSILPLALLMGIPFPLGLWQVDQFKQGDRHVALAWAVNGLMTVVGSATAVAMAMLAGFSSVLLVGAGAYAVAGIFLYVTRER
ncbi:MAG: hypothetical protein R3264_00030 [Anaerolineae bacterium]|nr:hypothetical protein [Anaerolineae bacterium]